MHTSQSRIPQYRYDVPPYLQPLQRLSRHSHSHSDTHSPYLDDHTSYSDTNLTRYRTPQRSWTTASSPTSPAASSLTTARHLHFDETIAKLEDAVKAIHEHLEPLKEKFMSEIEGVRCYASQAMLDELWEMRLELGCPSKSSGRKNVRRVEGSEEDADAIAEIVTMNRQARHAWTKAEKAMQVAAHGTKATISLPRRKYKCADNREGIERTIPKLQTIGRQCLELLVKSRKKYSQVGPLMKELRFLDQVMEDWKEFADGKNVEKDEDLTDWDGDY